MKEANNRKETYLYRDPEQPVDVRVQDLLGRMTIEEKIRETGFFMGRNRLKNKKHSLDLIEKQLGDMRIGGIQPCNALQGWILIFRQ